MLEKRNKIIKFSFKVVKIKPLLPSLREKPRYIKYKLNKKLSREYIYNNIKQFLGELGMAKAGVKMVNNNIVRTNNKHVDEVKSALMLIEGLNITKVSGLLGKIGG